MNEKMIERLETILQRNIYLSKMMELPHVVSDFKRYTQYAKEQANLTDVAEAYTDYKNTLVAKDEAKILMSDSDPEIAEMGKMEYDAAVDKIEQLEKDLQFLLLPKDPNDDKNVLVEIRGAAGGDEGNIFAGDLFRMYTRYAESKGWKIQMLDSNEGEMGGFSFISFLIKGERAYSELKYESGAHRVQRVPKTEASGRIHTSTATVLVMPEAEEVDFQINPSDLLIETCRASGAGGQHINKTDSAVRIVHIPTGIQVYCQEGRSQHENKETALATIRTRVCAEMTRKAEEERGAERKIKIGTGDRSEKIRTYNYPQNRVTDHRIGFTIQQLERVMDGDLNSIITALINEDQKLKLAGQSL